MGDLQTAGKEIIWCLYPGHHSSKAPLKRSKEKYMPEELVLYPDPILRDVARPVEDPQDPKYDHTMKLMMRILKETEGLGLAAPQVGVSERIILVKTDQGPMFLFNPEIVDRIGVRRDTESCLSLPKLEVSIKRARHVKVKGFDVSGRREVDVITSNDLTAACFQHEIDHLNGVLILDYACRQQKRGYKRMLNKK